MMRPHIVSRWQLCLIGAVLVAGLNGCHLLKAMPRQKHNPTEFSCGEPTPVGVARRPPPSTASRENRVKPPTSGSPDMQSAVR